MFLSLKIVLPSLANTYSEDPDEMLHTAAFHLDLHCLPIIPLYSFPGINAVKTEKKS